MDYLERICGLTEPLLWIQLVAEGSASTWRAFGVAMAKARRVNVEGSAFGLRRAKGSVKSKDWLCVIKGLVQHNHWIASVHPKPLVAVCLHFYLDKHNTSRFLSKFAVS